MVSPAQDVVAVLPDRFRNDQGRAGIQMSKDLHSHFLRVNKAMPFSRFEMVRADKFPTFILDGFSQQSLHFGLDRPALLVGGQAQIAAGDETGVSGRQ